MTFSEFAKILCTYCNDGETQAEFVIKLTDKIMGGRPGRAHADGTYQNPMRNKEPRILQAYFKGDRSIPQGDASILFCSTDKYKFEEYLRKRCSDDAQKMLLKDILQKAVMPKYSDADIAEICADLFEQILHDLAQA